jgi:hypothetical protein
MIISLGLGVPGLLATLVGVYYASKNDKRARADGKVGWIRKFWNTVTGRGQRGDLCASYSRASAIAFPISKISNNSWAEMR